MSDVTDANAPSQAIPDATAHATTPQPETSRYATVREAADFLGVSTETVRRMIRSGQLEGERVHRAQGSAYVVRIAVPNTAGDSDATATQQRSAGVASAAGGGTRLGG